MTVAELIAILSQYPAETPVMVLGYEGGYSNVKDVRLETMLLNVNRDWYYGPHEVENDFPARDYPNAEKSSGLIIE